MKYFKKSAAMFCGMVFAAGMLLAVAKTPYIQTDTDYINGATYELPTSDISETLKRDLYLMKKYYNIDVISVYTLDTFDSDGSDVNKDLLFSFLEEYDMKIVVRIERYDAYNFTFSESDAENVAESYRHVVEYVSDVSRRARIAYFAINMPVDDPNVQANLGGLNSTEYIENQPVYAEKIVRLMRQMSEDIGFYNAQFYLSVFYGWDNSFETPSYIDSGADGYFLNNYSYPLGGTVPDCSMSDRQIINADRLSVSLGRYAAQYKDKPLVVEFGFHTVSFNDGQASAQTAGLVADRSTKQRAIAATVGFYKNNYDFFAGAVYFGYNVLKSEGEDNLMLDWMLCYPEDSEILISEKPQVKNGGFEEELSFWGNTAPDGKTAVQSDRVHSGRNALKLTLSDKSFELFQSTAWSQNRCGLDGGYRLSAFADISGLNSGTVKLTAEFKNGGKTTAFYSSPEYSAAKEGFRKISVDVPQNAAGSYDEILFKAEISAGSGEIYIDDFIFEELNSVIYNSGFENGDAISAAEWGIYPSWSGGTYIDTDNSADGGRSIKITLDRTQHHSLYSTAERTETPSGEYVCTVKYCYESADGEITFRVNRSENNTVYSGTYALVGSSNGFREAAFYLPFDIDAEYLQLQADISVGSGAVWIDSFELQHRSGTANDVNNDGKFDITDLVRLKKNIAFGVDAGVISDVNNDGNSDASDIIFLRKKLLGEGKK